jgi:hypothetical protein
MRPFPRSASPRWAERPDHNAGQGCVPARGRTLPSPTPSTAAVLTREQPEHLYGGLSAPGQSIGKTALRFPAPRAADQPQPVQDAGVVVELVDEVRHGGRTERIYRATKELSFATEQTTNMSTDDVRLITLDILRMISADVEKALLGNSFDRLPDNHLSRVPLRVDRQGWDEVVGILDRALEEIMEVGRRACERQKETEEEPLDIRVGIMQFVMPGQGGYRGSRGRS